MTSAESVKNEGNALFKAGNYSAAIAKYDEAHNLDPTNAAYQSNAAACWEKLGNYAEMEVAARKCVSADKSFVKGYFRLATALKHQNDLTGCIKALESGLAVQSSNADLKKMKKEVTELVRAEQVASYCNKAEEMLMGGDIAGAHKTLELASRLDAGNAQIEKMMAKVKPKWEKMEKERKGNLSGEELFKEKGDEAYKAANFEEAIKFYTKCLDACADKTSEVALKAHSNRAACYKQISNFDGVIEDCSAVLEVEPENVKALIRRAQAFEGVERYRFALSDIKTVLSMPYEKIGKANYDLCNMMQHRLNRTVHQLKQMSGN
jgi:stress-induced-phosphoprotein 1